MSLEGKTAALGTIVALRLPSIACVVMLATFSVRINSRGPLRRPLLAPLIKHILERWCSATTVFCAAVVLALHLPL
eukprot:13971229-Alexandrium_andersonii.AAC.1